MGIKAHVIRQITGMLKELNAKLMLIFRHHRRCHKEPQIKSAGARGRRNKRKTMCTGLS
jgi:hypothetical protein